jgi:phosphate transport system permease protein
MKRRSGKSRKLADWTVRVLSSLAALIGIVFLVWIIYEVTMRGARSISPDFFFKLPTPPGVPGGGVANAILGTLMIIFMAALIGVPTGVLAGVYLSEFGQETRFGGYVRFANNVMMGVPSIIVGLFVYTLLVLSTGHFSAYAGAVALAIIMLPVIARTTEDMLHLVPNGLREAALAIGSPRWKATLSVVFRAAKSGLITGVLLAMARVSGETAPLLFTAMNAPYWPRSLSQPTANLTVTIFNYAMSPYRDWQQTAWGAALVIMAAVLALNVFIRLSLREAKK